MLQFCHVLRLAISTGHISDYFALADSHTWDLEKSSEDLLTHHMIPGFNSLFTWSLDTVGRYKRTLPSMQLCANSCTFWCLRQFQSKFKGQDLTSPWWKEFQLTLHRAWTWRKTGNDGFYLIPIIKNFSIIWFCTKLQTACMEKSVRTRWPQKYFPARSGGL